MSSRDGVVVHTGSFVATDPAIPPAGTIADAERQLAVAPPDSGGLELFDKQIKLFADGAIISRLMQTTDPYLDADGQPPRANRASRDRVA